MEIILKLLEESALNLPPPVSPQSQQFAVRDIEE